MGLDSRASRGQTQVVEDLGVVGGLGVEVGEDLECGGQVSGGERVVGLLDEGGAGCGLRVGVGEVLRGEREGEQRKRDEEPRRGR